MSYKSLPDWGLCDKSRMTESLFPLPGAFSDFFTLILFIFVFVFFLRLFFVVVARRQQIIILVLEFVDVWLRTAVGVGV